MSTSRLDARMPGPKLRQGEAGTNKEQGPRVDRERLETFLPTGALLFHAKSHSWPTHHTDGEIVVHDVVWDLVSIINLLSGDDFQMPAVQHHQGALLDVLQDFCQAAPFITCRVQYCICPRAERLGCCACSCGGGHPLDTPSVSRPESLRFPGPQGRRGQSGVIRKKPGQSGSQNSRGRAGCWPKMGRPV